MTGLLLAIGIGWAVGWLIQRVVRRRRRPVQIGTDVTRQWLHENTYDRTGDDG